MPRFLGNSIGITTLTVTGALPGKEELFPLIAGALTSHAFKPIDDGTETESAGWVQLNDTAIAAFDNPGFIWVDNYIFFSLRHDKRKVPDAVLKQETKKGEQEWLKDKPNFRRPPKKKREEIKETATLKLLAKTLPVPTVTDCIWDMEKGVVHLMATSGKAVDRFIDLFHKTFSDVHLSPITPYHRAEKSVAGTALAEILPEHNQAGSDSVMSLINDNKWLGRDFLLWLLAGAGESAVPNLVAWIDKKLAMAGESGEGELQKVTISGPLADRMMTIKAALLDGKWILGAGVHIEAEENRWQFGLNGETFAIASMKTPSVLMERNPEDELNEYQAAALEKIRLVNKGLDYLQDLLRAFLKERLTDRWSGRLVEIQSWMEEG